MHHEGVFMSKREEYVYSVVSDFIVGKLKRVEAARLLDIAPRSVSRLARRIQHKGFLGAKHGNLGRAPVNRHPDDFKQLLMELVERRYFDFNLTHALELLRKDHGVTIGYETFRRYCHERGLVKRRHKRRAKARVYRVRMPHEGLLLQMDGSVHRWNGRDEWCLIAMIDDATSRIPHAEFFPAEDTLSCMSVLESVIRRFGIPEAIYVDRAGWTGGAKRQMFSQFHRACEELGTRVLFANSPQAKGRIERAFGTLQDRLVPELRLRNIRRIPNANRYLQQEFIPQYWENRCVVTAREPERRYRSLPAHIDLNEVLCLKELRQIKGDHTVHFQAQRYVIAEQLKYALWRQKIEFRTYRDLSWRAFFAGRPIALEPVIPPARRAG